MKKVLSAILLTINSLLGTAQGINQYLDTVAENNPEIIALNRLLEARYAEVRTGITPPDPSVTFGYMPGSTGINGVKKIWSVNQSFSFPLKYIIQKKLSKNYYVLAEYEFRQAKLSTLLDAKLTLYELIHREKLLELLEKRSAGYNKLRSAWKIMLDNGEATVLDYNKIIMELSSVGLEISRVKAEMNQIKEKLDFLNGTSGFIPMVPDYPEVVEMDLEQLIAEKSGVHPGFLIPKTEYLISQEELKLAKAESLPEIQLAYSSEMIPGETFTGPVGGITLPLWANANRIKSSSAYVMHAEAGKEAALSGLISEIRGEYSVMLALGRSVSELRSILEENGKTGSYETALENGEISIIDYFSYLDIIFSTEERLLETELEYQKAIARLSDHTLLK